MKKDLFTVGQVCKVCGISRSTVLRLEEKGLIIPAYCNDQSGYRYYDNHNINKILQIKAFQEMGLEYEDIIEYYSSGGNSSGLIQKLEYRASVFKRTLEEMRLRNNDKNHLSCELINLPDYICFARKYTGSSFSEEYDNMYNLCHEAFKKGYRMIATEPLFIMWELENYLTGIFGGAEMKYTCCIPVEPECASEETTIVPGGKAISILYYGDYTGIREQAPDILMKKIRELELKPSGTVRGLCIVAPYMGREIKPDKFVSRIIVPVEE